MKMFKLESFVFVLNIIAALGTIPEGITQCSKGDNGCFAKSLQEVLKNYSNGVRELHLIPFDPLAIKKLLFKRNPSSPVNVELKFENLKMTGLKTGHVTEIKGFNFKERSLLDLEVPELTLEGDYSADGKVLILPITGAGKCKIIAKNIHLKFTFELEEVLKNGKTFAQLTHSKLELIPKFMEYQLDNLFKGDHILGENMNKFINENWQEIFHELKPPMDEGFTLVITKLVNDVLSSHPYDELFH